MVRYFIDIPGMLPYSGAQTNKEKNEAIKTFTGEHTKKFLKFYNDLLKENGNSSYFVGDSMTIADFMVLTITHTYLTHNFYKTLYGDVLNDYPELKKFTEERVEELKEYYDNRADFPITYVVQSKLDMLDEEENIGT